MANNTSNDGAPGTTEQSPRWEGPKDNKPRGYIPAKDNSDVARDAVGETIRTLKSTMSPTHSRHAITREFAEIACGRRTDQIDDFKIRLSVGNLYEERSPRYGNLLFVQFCTNIEIEIRMQSILV